MIRTLYVWLEKRFFNSIPKKIVGNVLFLSVVMALAGRLSTIDGLIYFAFPTGILMTLFTILFLKHIIDKPVKELIYKLNNIMDGNADLTKELHVSNYDEIRTLAQTYNRFLKYLGEIIAKMQVTSNEVNRSIIVLSNQTSKTSKDAQNLMDLAAQTAVSSEELSHTITQIVRHTSDTTTTTHDSMDQAVKGNNIAADAVAAVNNLHQTTVELSVIFGELNKKTTEIGDIVIFIKDIADQTNLLALNAAIEAARAGEQGRGFSVVADEVRKLAERTIKATSEISHKISAVQADAGRTTKSMEESVSEVEKATTCIDQVGNALREIVGSAKKVQAQMEEISKSLSNQGTATEEIAKSADNSKMFATNMAGTSKGTNDEIVRVRRNAREIIELITRIRVDQSPEILLEKSKADIYSMVIRVDNHFEGSERLDTNILADYKNSRFGQWYYNEGKKDLGEVRGYSSIEGTLIELHKAAANAVDMFNKNNLREAGEAHKKVKALSEQLIALLDGLRNEAASKRYRYGFTG